MARSDAASATRCLTHFLDNAHVRWTLGAGRTAPWPPCVYRVTDVPSHLRYLANMPFSVGYVPTLKKLFLKAVNKTSLR